MTKVGDKEAQLRALRNRLGASLKPAAEIGHAPQARSPQVTPSRVPDVQAAQAPAGGQDGSAERRAPKARGPRKGGGASLTAPVGQCEFCDRRRSYAAAAMKRAYKPKK